MNTPTDERTTTMAVPEEPLPQIPEAESETLPAPRIEVVHPTPPGNDQPGSSAPHTRPSSPATNPTIIAARNSVAGSSRSSSAYHDPKRNSLPPLPRPEPAHPDVRAHLTRAYSEAATQGRGMTTLLQHEARALSADATHHYDQGRRVMDGAYSDANRHLDAGRRTMEGAYVEASRHLDTGRRVMEGAYTEAGRGMEQGRRAVGEAYAEAGREGRRAVERVGTDLRHEGQQFLRNIVDTVDPLRWGHGPDWRGSAARSISTAQLGPRRLADRLHPTLEHAKAEREKSARKARLTGMALNIAIGAQVVLGALTTGLAAATTGRTSSIVVSVFGGASTCVATYLARVRGSGEPETSKQRVKDLDYFIRDCEALLLDKGHAIGKIDDNGEKVRDTIDETVDEFRRRFEDLIGNHVEHNGADTRKPMV